MNPEKFFFDEDDKKLYHALQKAGEVFPCDLDDLLEESIEHDELPTALQDVENAVKQIMSGDNTLCNGGPTRDLFTIKPCKADSEWALAARHGVKLSEASREKISKLRKKPGEAE